MNLHLMQKRLLASKKAGIITNGLVLNLDAGNPLSYPGTGIIWNDLSGNGNNGTLVNGPAFNSVNGGSIVFDGVNDFVSLGNFALSSLPKGSISAWVKLASGGLPFQMIAGKRSLGSVNGFDYMVDLSSTGTNIRGIVSNRSNINIITGTTTLLYNVWYFIVFTWSGSFLNVFLNGNINATQQIQNVSVSSSSTLPFDIAIARDTTPRYYKGNIGEVDLYNRALSASEILQNYNATKSRFGL